MSRSLPPNMTQADWEALPPDVRLEIVTSCTAECFADGVDALSRAIAALMLSTDNEEKRRKIFADGIEHATRALERRCAVHIANITTAEALRKAAGEAHGQG